MTGRHSEMVFLDFVPQSDVVHKGRMLSLCIVSQVKRLKERSASLYFVAEDVNGDVETILLCNLRQNTVLLEKGAHVQVANPYQRMSLDMRSMVRVDQPDSEFRVVWRCNWCNVVLDKPLECSVCSAAFYCNKDHQTKDWKAHKEICKKKQERQ